MARSAPRAAAALIRHAFLQPCTTRQPGRLASPASRGAALMEALSQEDSSRASTGLLAAAARGCGLGDAVSQALAQASRCSAAGCRPWCSCSGSLLCTA